MNARTRIRIGRFTTLVVFFALLSSVSAMSPVEPDWVAKKLGDISWKAIDATTGGKFVIVAGYSGKIGVREGGTWSFPDSGTSISFYDAACTDTHAIAVGWKLVRLLDRVTGQWTTWTPTDAGTLTHVLMTDDVVYVVGYSSTYLAHLYVGDLETGKWTAVALTATSGSGSVEALFLVGSKLGMVERYGDYRIYDPADGSLSREYDGPNDCEIWAACAATCSGNTCDYFACDAAGQDAFTCYDGEVGGYSDICNIPSGTTVKAIAGDCEDDFFACGDKAGEGVILRCTNGVLSDTGCPSGVGYCTDMCVVGDSAYVCTASGYVLCSEPGDRPTVANTRCCGVNGDPVSTFTGELFFHEPADLRLGGPLPLFFRRYYASYLRRGFVTGDLGDNWRHNFEWSAHWTGNQLTLVDDRGRKVRFSSDGQGNWTQLTNLEVPIQIRQDGTEIRIYDPATRLVRRFDGGKLIRVEDGKGNALVCAWDAAGRLESVTDGLGRALRFEYAKAGLFTKLVSVIEQQDGKNQRTVAFGYDATGDHLVQVIDAKLKYTTYEYAKAEGADRALLLYKTYPLGNEHFSQLYYGTADGEDAGRVKQQSDGLGNVYEFAYDGDETTITDPLGHSRVHTHSEGGRLLKVRDETEKEFELGYDADGRRNSLKDRLGDEMTGRFDALSGDLVERTNADGTTTRYTYASRIQDGFAVRDLVGIEYPDGVTETFTYDASGNLVKRTDPRGGEWTFTVNGRGQVLTVTSPLGGVTTYTYHADGTVATVTDHAGNTTKYHYDAMRRLAKITWPDGTDRTFSWNFMDQIVSITDERGHESTCWYDDNGNLVKLRDAAGHETTYAYDAMDRLLEVTDPLGNVVRRTFDERGLPETVTDPEGRSLTVGRDARAWITSLTDAGGKEWPRTNDDESVPTAVSDPLGRKTEIVTDEMGRVLRTKRPRGGETVITYDAMGRPSDVRDPLGQVTEYEYDAWGRLVKVSLPGELVASAYTWNLLGQLTRVTDPNGKDWISSFDAAGRLLSYTDPLGNRWGYVYDENGRIERIELPASHLEFSYDATGNVTRRLYSDGTQFDRVHDKLGRLTSANGVEIRYDAAGRIEESNGFTVSRDRSGRLVTLTLAPGKAVTYAYDARGQLRTVTDWTGKTTTFTHDDAGRLVSISRPNGVTTEYSYNEDGQVASITEGALAKTTLARDLTGRVTSAEREMPTAGGLPREGVSTHTFDAASQVGEYTYDEMGRLTDDGTRSYVWDLASRLTSYTEGGASVSFTYDALGNRLSRTSGGATREYTWNYAFRLPSVSVERSGGSDLRYYVHTPEGALLYSLDSAGSRREYHYDETGNTRFLTDDSGNVTATYAYGAYGDLLTETGDGVNSFTWRGQLGLMREGSGGMYYVRARYYDSATGRFLSRDPIHWSAPRTINPYQYASGDPVRFGDPTGLQHIRFDQTAPLPILPGHEEVGGTPFKWPHPSWPQPAASLRDQVGTLGYYAARNADYLARHGTNPPDYYLQYGAKYAWRFTLVLWWFLSPTGKVWIQDTFVLLQEAIEDKRDEDPVAFDALEQDPDAFREFAYSTHSDAYLQGGLGELPVSDLAFIAATPDPSDLATWAGVTQVVETGVQMPGKWFDYYYLRFKIRISVIYTAVEPLVNAASTDRDAPTRLEGCEREKESD